MRITLFASILIGFMISACKTEQKINFRCGAAETIITNNVKDRKEVYGDLYARALVMAEEKDRLVIVTVDMGSFDSDYVNVLLEKINRATGIPSGNIIIEPSHTHNAPGVDGREMSPESKAWLAGAIAELAEKAMNNVQPATLRIGRAPVQIGYNRRLMKDDLVIMEPNPKGAVVPWTDVLGAYGKDGKRIAVLFSHAAHPVIVHWSSEAVGPDFPGYAVTHLRNLLSKDGDPEGVFMFAQGCYGNINGFPLRGGIAACDAAGLSLAFAVTRGLAEARNVTSGRFRTGSLNLTLPLQDPPSMEECKKLIAKEPDFKGYKEWLRIAESREPQFTVLPMFAIAIGKDLCFLAISGEMFAEYQLWLEKASPFRHTFVFSIANGYTGYIATKKDYEMGESGGYESWYRPVVTPPHWLPLRPEAEQLICEGILQLLEQVK